MKDIVIIGGIIIPTIVQSKERTKAQKDSIVMLTGVNLEH